MEQGYWFTSSKFEISKGEDDETNPGCYGRSLAQWLSTRFSALGYATEVIPEDWGWCVMCQRTEFLLWIGCGVIQPDKPFDSENPPLGNSVVWHVFPNTEIPIFMFKSKLRKWFGKLDTTASLQKLDEQLKQVLTAEPSIQFCPEP